MIMLFCIYFIRNDLETQSPRLRFKIHNGSIRLQLPELPLNYQKQFIMVLIKVMHSYIQNRHISHLGFSWSRSQPYSGSGSDHHPALLLPQLKTLSYECNVRQLQFPSLLFFTRGSSTAFLLYLSPYCASLAHNKMTYLFHSINNFSRK